MTRYGAKAGSKPSFGPTIQSGADVDYLGVQGFWVCTVIGALTFFFTLMTGRPVLAASMFLFFHFGGVGVRERDLFAGVIVFAYYALDTLISLVFLLFATPWGMIVFRVAFSALLLSTLRATWIASNWQPDSERAAFPPRFSETWSDKLADQWPAWMWPKVRIAYYILSLLFLLLTVVGVAVLVLRPFMKL